MSNSPLATYFRRSPNYYSGRKYNGHNTIDRITPHCVVGQCSVETLGNIFSRTEKDASCNYGVGFDGRIGCYVDECDTSWCSSSRENDSRAVTLEIASDTTYPYAVRDAAWAAAINLMEDICRRNGKSRVVWFGNLEQTEAYKPAPEEMVISVHRWFANKSCPGEWIYSRLNALKDELNRRLMNSSTVTPTPATDDSDDEMEVCEVTLPILRIGDESGYVRTMQILLNKYNNARISEDGIFGPATYSAVVKYQRSRRLDVDGVCGKQTWGQLLK